MSNSQNVKKFLYALLKDTEEQVYIYLQDFREAIFLASNFTERLENNKDLIDNIDRNSKNNKDENSKDNKNNDFFARINEKIKNYEKIEENLYNNIQHWYQKLEIEKDINDLFILEFNNNRDRIVKSLDILMEELRNSITTLSELIESLPSRMSNVLRYTRKMDVSEKKLLNNIGNAYFDSIENLFEIIEGGNSEIIDNIKKLIKNSKEKVIYYLDHSSATKYENSNYFNKLLIRVLKINEEDILKYSSLPNSVILPFWILRMPKYLNFLAHEFSHSVYEYIINFEQKNTNFSKKIKNIKKRVERILSTYSFNFMSENQAYTFSEIFVQEIIVDFLSLLISGPSYYFALFSNVISEKPFMIRVKLENVNPYVRLKTLNEILKKLLKVEENFNNSKGRYWFEFLKFSEQYLNSLKNTATYGETDEITCFSINLNIQLYDDLVKFISKGIIDEFIKSEDEIKRLFKWKYLEDDSNIKNIINKVFKSQDFEDDDLNIENIGINEYFDYNIQDNYNIVFPEYLWDIFLYNIYNINDENKLKKLRVPYSRIARIFGLKEREFLINKNKNENEENKNKNEYEFELRKPNEWLLIEMNWKKLSELVNEKEKKYIAFNEIKENNNRNKIMLKSLQEIFEKSKEKWRIDGKAIIDEKFKIKSYISFGECDYLIILNDTSTRRKIDWPLYWFTVKKGEKEKIPTGLYRFRRFINEKVEIKKKKKKNNDNEDSGIEKDNIEDYSGAEKDNSDAEKDNIEDYKYYLISLIKLKSPEKDIKDFIININNKLREENYCFEIYLSNSWNDITLKVGIIKVNEKNNEDHYPKIKEILNIMDNIKKDNNEKIEIEERQSFLIFKAENNKNDNNKNDNNKIVIPESYTLLQTLDIKNIKDYLGEFLDNNMSYIKEYNTLLGVYDYIIKWKELDLEQLLKVIDDLIKKDLKLNDANKDENKNKDKDNVLLLNINTLIPFDINKTNDQK